MKSKSVFIFLICNIVLVLAETNSTNQPQEQKTSASSQAISYTTPAFWPEQWKTGATQVLSVSGVILSGIFIFAGIVWFLGVQAFNNLRLCNWMGTCEKQAVQYNAGGNLQDPSMQGSNIGEQYPYYPGAHMASNYIKKRSISLLTPILKKLASTFDTMENDQKQEPPMKKQR